MTLAENIRVDLKTEKTKLTVTLYGGVELVRCRERLGLSQLQFALAAGWSQSRQQRLESNCWNRLDAETAKGFDQAGVSSDLAAIANESMVLGILARRASQNTR